MSNFDSSSYNPNAGSSIPKILNPGSHILAIREIAIDYPPYNPSAIFLQFLVESQPVSDDSFEGILKDKQDPSKGSWAGQIARVKSGRFPFSTFTYNGRVVERDAQIFRFIMKLVEQLNVLDLVQKADIKADTIEDYVTKVAPFLTNKWAFFTLGGMEYYTEGYDRQIGRAHV